MSVDPTEFTVAPPEGTEFQGLPDFAVSPDGRLLVFAAVSHGQSQLWLRARRNPTPTPIPGTEGASFPFWSPDNQVVAFFASRQLRKVRIDRGPAEVICDAPAGRGGSWNQQNEIVFAPGTDGPLMRVNAAGGPQREVTSLDRARKDTTHRHPSFLPDGKHFLFSAEGGPTEPEIQIGSMESQEIVSIGLTGRMPIYSSHYILFSRGSSLVAQPFDPATRRLTGDSITLAEDVGAFSASAAGVLAHAAERWGQLTWLDRTGRVLGTVGDRAFMVALSPDERRVATGGRHGAFPQNSDIVLFDLTRPQGARRFTFDPGTNFFPVWAPDGTRLVFASTRNGRFQMFQRSVDISGRDELLLDDAAPPRNIIVPTDWSPDGRYIAYTRSGRTTMEMSMLPLFGSRAPLKFQEWPPGNKGHAHFSPDGRWVAYTSDESGRAQEVYVAAFAGGGSAHQISDGGGTQPLWSRDGKELFFFSLDGSLMRVAVDANADIKTDVPSKLFSIPVNLTTGWGNEYAVNKDGRFLIDVLRKRTPITMVVDWVGLTRK